MRTDFLARSALARAFGAVAALALIAPFAAADVTIVTSTTTRGIGGFGNTTGTETQVLTKDRERTESDSKYTGRFKTFAGGANRSARIVRLDQGVVWELNPDKKTYTELTFDEMRAQMEHMADQMKQAQAQMEDAKRQAKEETADAGITTTYDVDVKQTGEHQDIAGFACARAIVTCTATTTSTKNPAANAKTEYVMDEWLSDKIPGAAEAIAFRRAFAEKLGMEQMAAQVSPMAASMYGDAVGKMAAKLKDLHGYAMKTTFTVRNVASPEARAKAAEAKEQQQQAMAEGKEAEKKGESADNASDASQAGMSAAHGGKGMGGVLGGFMAHHFAHSMAKKSQEQTEQMSNSTDANGPLFESVTEVTRVTPDAAAASFDVPAGYKKVEAPRAAK
jgi:hypothetical protein